jgi:hypothetical protein
MAGIPGAMQDSIRLGESLLYTILMQIGCSKFLPKAIEIVFG